MFSGGWGEGWRVRPRSCATSATMTRPHPPLLHPLGAVSDEIIRWLGAGAQRTAMRGEEEAGRNLDRAKPDAG